jgi:4-amino-4-deoxy-L-arabinose transferase-like glycosyltransferase
VPDAPNSSLLVRYRYLLLLVLGLLIYVSFLGMRDLWYPDEPDIGEVCKAMFESGDWIAPRRMGVIWVDYPPMIYWVGTISSHLLGGMTAFALRLPNALTAIGVTLLTCAVGSRWFNPRTGLWAGFLLLTFFQFVLQAVGYRPDVLFTVTIAAGMFIYAAGVGDRPRWLFRLAAFALFGLAMLAKGPLGLLLPGLVLVLWLVSRREWRFVLELAPLSLVALAVYLPWFVACAREMGSDNILYELYAQNFERFLSGGRGHGQPIYYYFVNVWHDLVPWSFLLPFALWSVLRGGLRRDRNVQLALWWFGTFLVFLSLAATKRQLYLLPAYPAIALLMAPWIAAVGREDHEETVRPGRRPVRVYALTLSVVFAVLALTLFAVAGFVETFVGILGLENAEVEVAHAMRAPLAAFGGALLLAACWIGTAWRRKDVRGILSRVGASHVVLYVILLAGVLPAAHAFKSYRPQGAWIRQQIGGETHIGLVYPGMSYRKMGAFGYYSGALVDRLETTEEVERFFDEHPTSLVLIHEDSVGRIFAADETAWRARILRELRTGSHLYVVVRGP